jgi:hypothetical protein
MMDGLFLKGGQGPGAEALHTWGFPTDRPALLSELF